MNHQSTLQRDEAPRVIGVSDDSPASVAGIVVGDIIESVDGQRPRDVIEWQWATDVSDPTLEVRRHTAVFELTVPKREGEPIGLDVHSAVFDRVRTCDNHCEFCFIHQLPKGMRRSLYLKDDDYRLSFLYGNFTTLTRFTESDLERVITERLSPLHVSIHAIEPDARNMMLKNRRGAMSLRWLRALLDAGIEVRGQIVVCPGVNDGEVLERTLLSIADQYSELTSVAVVPLGVSSFNPEERMRPHTIDEAMAVLQIVDDWQEINLGLSGRRTVFAADEYYLLAGREFPALGSYEGCPMHEDGIGMARTFEAEFAGTVGTTTSPRRGFFDAVDSPMRLPANPAAYTGLRAEPVQLTSSPRSRTRRSTHSGISILTGTLGAEVIRPLISSLGRSDIDVRPVENRFFGGNTGVSGLLTGSDLIRHLDDAPTDRRYLLPDVCLSDDGMFLDGHSLADLPRTVEVIPTDGAALRRALEAV